MQAFLNDLGFKRFGIRASLAHCDPDDKDDGVHLFLSGEHRLYGWDQVSDFTSRLGITKALDHSLKRWVALSRYLDDGTVPIDNNHIENQIRPWALGRKNWVFAGSLRS